MIETKSGREQS